MNEKKPELSIVLPTYKERENLAVLIPQIEAEFPDVSIEIVVVDDNSQDGAGELLREMNRTYQNIVFLERPGLLGIGSALRDGYNAARGEYILSSDADLSFAPQDMRRLFEKIRDGFDLVLGYRITHMPAEGGGAKSFIGWLEMTTISPMSNFIIRVISGVGLKNYNTNFRIIRSSTWRSFRTSEDRQFFLFETIFRAKQEGAKMTEIPVTFCPRQFGKSKVSFFKQAPGYFLKLIRYKFF